MLGFQVSPLQEIETDKSLLTLATFSAFAGLCHAAVSLKETRPPSIWLSNLPQGMCSKSACCVYKPERLICWSCQFSRDFSQLVTVAESLKDNSFCHVSCIPCMQQPQIKASWIMRPYDRKFEAMSDA